MNQKYVINSDENKAFLKELGEELLEFGHRFPAPEGGSFYLSDDGTPIDKRPIETWITCRMAHVYSMGAMKGYKGCKKLAHEAIKGLVGRLHDDINGGWYSGVTQQGEVLPLKQCYAHAFVILAASSAYLAGISGAEELLKEALEVYDRFFWNEEEGLACDTWNTQFTELDSYRGLNANMHTVEAFLAVADATGDDKYRFRAGRIIDHVFVWAQENDWRIPEHFNEEWVADLECNKDRPADPFKPYGATPGHGIEWARLITQWALSFKPDNVEEYLFAAQNLYNRAIIDAWKCDGKPGICYTTDWNGKPVVHDRMHWTLAEAINTSAVLFQVTQNPKYAEDFSEFMEYLDTTVHDKKNGSWFHQLDENNELLTTVWPGKSDLYHAFQAMLIPYSDVSVSIATAVYRSKTFDVVALGELLIDFTENGKSNQGNTIFEANPGGAPCNVLAMLSKLGKKTAFVGKVGRDSFGDMLEETIEEVGIDSSFLLRDNQVHTTLAFVHNFEDGDRSFSFYRNPGADMMLRPDDISENMFKNVKIFHFGTLSMTDEKVCEATLKAVEFARAQGCIISLDPNLREPLWESLDIAKTMMRKAVSLCDVLKISDNEIQFLTGLDDYDEGINALRAEYNPKLICLTMGKDGSRAYYKDLKVDVPGFLQENVVDTTGAGDTFCGSVLNFICEKGIENLTGEDLEKMLTFANAAAGLVTTKKGALRSMPEIEQVENLINRGIQ